MKFKEGSLLDRLFGRGKKQLIVAGPQLGDLRVSITQSSEKSWSARLEICERVGYGYGSTKMWKQVLIEYGSTEEEVKAKINPKAERYKKQIEDERRWKAASHEYKV